MYSPSRSPLPPPSLPNILLFLAEDDFKVRILNILVSYSILLGFSHIYMLLHFVNFLLLICLMSVYPLAVRIEEIFLLQQAFVSYIWDW